MRYVTVLTLFSLGFLSAAICSANDNLRVMTYNIRYAGDRAPNAWAQRKSPLVEMIHKHLPDVLGTQEALYLQVKDLESSLSKYRWIGIGRDGGSRGEFMAVFYRNDRLEPLEFDHFWLSDTPEIIGSTSWGNTNRRMVTWVRFRVRETDKEFFFFNTHFDHQIQESREKSADLVLARVRKLETKLPVILVGDFNAAAGENPVYDKLVNAQAFQDTWTTGKQLSPQHQTFNGFKFPTPEQGPRIDWILYRGPLGSLNIVVDNGTYEKSQYPSDHFPVIADFRVD